MAETEPPVKKSGVGKIPVWVWIAGAGVLGGIVYFMRKNAANAATAAASNTSGATAPSTTDDTSGLATDQYEQLLAQVRELQGQESAEAPAPAGAAGPAGPTGPAGPPGTTTPAPPKTTPPPGTKPPVKTAPPPAKPKTVTTAAYPAWNSTLSGIASHENTTVDKLWSANQALIEGQEIKHGMTKAVADQRKWLYPGEVITIP
jgi:hypothetical protein